MRVRVPVRGCLLLLLPLLELFLLLLPSPLLLLLNKCIHGKLIGVVGVGVQVETGGPKAEKAVRASAVKWK